MLWQHLCAVVQVPESLIPLQSNIEGMIWEVDEDCDQALTWTEFQAMYHRCRNDQTGEYYLPIHRTQSAEALVSVSLAEKLLHCTNCFPGLYTAISMQRPLHKFPTVQIAFDCGCRL